MEPWTAFVLGLAGSPHCAGMCGPLLLALAAGGGSPGRFALGRVVYHSGRILSYSLIGMLLGVIGQSLALAGLQRWLSLGAGLVVLIGLGISFYYPLNLPVWKAVSLLKPAFSGLLRQRSLGATFCLGAVNGFLPCGLVYVASAGAMASGDATSSLVWMVAFGLGTLPVTLGLGLAGRTAQEACRSHLRKLAPISVALVGILLLLRGLSLGIPYLSPDLSMGGANCH